MPVTSAGSAPRRACLVFAGALVAASLLTLSGCVTPPPPDAGGQNQRSWQGRFSVTMLAPPGPASSTPDSREERAHGTFSLTRSQERIKLELYSPFGQTMASATSDPTRGAQLTTSDGRQFVAADPDTLMERALGWQLPISALPDWLSGTGLEPGDEATVLQGWSVKAEKRFDNGTPRRIAARWPASQRYGERRINLFLVVDRTS